MSFLSLLSPAYRKIWVQEEKRIFPLRTFYLPTFQLPLRYTASLPAHLAAVLA